MSGQFVGMVLDAAEAGRLEGISTAALHALVAIAEGCHDDGSAEGNVSMARIRAAIGSGGRTYRGNSQRTAVRAVAELRDAGYVTLVAKGYRLPSGEAKSNRYRFNAEVVRGDADANPIGATDADAGANPVGVTDPDADAKSAHADAKSAHADANPIGTLPVFNPVSIPGGCGADATAAPAPVASIPTDDDDPEPPRYCDDHDEDTEDPCWKCGRRGKRHAAWVARAPQREQRRKNAAFEAIADAIAACADCDDHGWLLDDDGTPNNDGIHCTHVTTAHIHERKS